MVLFVKITGKIFHINGKWCIIMHIDMGREVRIGGMI